MKTGHWLLAGIAVYMGWRLLGKVQLWNQLEFSLADVKPGIDRRGVYVDCQFRLDNKTAHNLTINSIDGWILYKTTQLAKLTALDPQTVQPGTSTFAIILRPTFAGTAEIIQKLIRGGAETIKQDFVFDGAVTVEGLTMNVKQNLEW